MLVTYCPLKIIFFIYEEKEKYRFGIDLTFFGHKMSNTPIYYWKQETLGSIPTMASSDYSWKHILSTRCLINCTACEAPLGICDYGSSTAVVIRDLTIYPTAYKVEWSY